MSCKEIFSVRSFVCFFLRRSRIAKPGNRAKHSPTESNTKQQNTQHSLRSLKIDMKRENLNEINLCQEKRQKKEETKAKGKTKAKSKSTDTGAEKAVKRGGSEA